jgi:hypothetical protein
MQWRALLALAISLVLAHSALAADIPQVGDTDLEQVIALAGSNRAQLEQALFSCQQKPFTMAAMRFLVASLPSADLGVIQADALTQHVDLAMQARGGFAYAKSYDDATWAHYVLAPRVSQEPLSPWRPYFLEQLRDIVAACATLEEAAVKVNEWCGQHVTYKPTQSRDQGPLVTLKSGYGRCEEEVIFFVCACRSVGIPARQAYCPYWSTGDDNHAWAEVLGSDGRWHYTGGCEPHPVLDDAWFNQSVKNAPLVVSVSFGTPGSTETRDGQAAVNESGEEILNAQDAPGARYCTLNSTMRYRRTGRLTVEAPGATGDSRLGIYVFNYGALRLIARAPYKNGVASITLGPGAYVLSTASATGPRAALFTVEPGVDSRINWDEQAALPPDVLLHFPADTL